MDSPPSTRRSHAATWHLFEDRASTQVLGFALMFSVTMTTFAIYQADVVPHQNEQVEFEHNQGMAEELGKLRGAAQQAGHGVPTATTLGTGAAYPERAVAVNPTNPRGRLWTSGVHTAELTDIEPADGDYWTGGSQTFETRLATYRANYQYIEGATYSFEHGVPAKHFPNGNQRVLGSPSVIDGNRIDLVLMGGDFDRKGLSTTVEFRPVSSSTEYRTLKRQDGEITLPTRLTRSEWESLVPSHVDVSVDTAPDPNEVTLELDSSRTYQLRITKLKLVDEDGSASQASVGMLTAKTTTTLPVNPDESTSLTVTARDEYGNPVPGVEVEFTPSDPDIGSTQTLRTGSDGESTYRVSPSTTVNGNVTASVVGGPESTTFDLQVPGSASTDGELEVYASGQKAEALGDVRSLTLSNAWTVRTTDENCRLTCDTGGVLGSLLGIFNSDYTLWTTSGTLYLESSSSSDDLWIEYHVIDQDKDGKVAESGDGVFVEIRSKDKQRHSNREALLFTGELTGSAGNEIADRDATGTDILDATNYEDANWEGQNCNGLTCNSWGYGDSFDDFGDVTAELTDVDLFVEAAAGRVTVEVSN
jgi:hypothetical protein